MAPLPPSLHVGVRTEALREQKTVENLSFIVSVVNSGTPVFVNKQKNFSDLS